MKKYCPAAKLFLMLVTPGLLCFQNNAQSKVILYKNMLVVMPEAGNEQTFFEDEAVFLRGCSDSKTFCNLRVTRTAQINNLFVSGNEQIDGNLSVGGSETIAGDLFVGGNETVNGNLVVNGTITANSIIGGPSVFLDTLFAVVDAIDQTKKFMFDVQGSSGTTTTLVTNPTTNRVLTTTGYDGTLLASDAVTGQVFIGANTTLHGSNSGVQYSSTFPSRAQYRANQYGNANGVPGISSFKSRGATIGSLAPVIVGDVIFRDTAVGVTSNLSIPLSGMISINTTAVPVGQGFIGTEFEIQLVPNTGPVNGRRVAFKVSGDGIVSVREGANHMAGVATLVGGTVTVANTNVPAANARIMLTVQPGTAPTGFIYVSAIVPSTSFTITSTSGVDTCNVYYQIYQPTP